MSTINIESNPAYNGDVDITSPNSDTDRTLTLPDEDGTLILSTTDIDADINTVLNASGSAPSFACRAWINFNGVAATIYDSRNVSSLTDGGVGYYQVNFTTAMPDENYSANITGTCAGTNYGFAQQDSTLFSGNGVDCDASFLNIRGRDMINAAQIDHAWVCAAIIR